jgi:hypothetical protein
LTPGRLWYLKWKLSKLPNWIPQAKLHSDPHTPFVICRIAAVLHEPEKFGRWEGRIRVGEEV